MEKSGSREGQSLLPARLPCSTESNVGDVVCQGDVIEAGVDSSVVIQFVDGTTFQLHANGRIELGTCRAKPEEFVGSPLVRVLQGVFSFIAGKATAAGRLIIDTPVAQIQSRTGAAGIGSFAFTALTLGLIHDLKAASADIGLIDDGSIDYKDLKHGVFEIRTKEAHPRIIVVDDPSVTIELRPHGGGTVGVDQVANTPAQMSQLQSAFQSAYSTFTQGQQDPFIQQQERGNPNDHANAQPGAAPSSIGSSTALNDLNTGAQGLGEVGATQLALNEGGGLSSTLPPSAPPVTGTTSSTPTTSTLPPPIGTTPVGPTPTVQWISASGGNWEAAASWSDNIVPGSANTVQILVPVNITLSSSESAAGLIIGAGATLDIVAGGSLMIAGTINNAGTIVLDDPPIYISGTVTAAGGGVVTMLGASTANVVTGVPGTGATLINVDNTISGAGLIGQGDGHLTFVNDAAGTINANASGQSIVINTGHQVSNAGILEATNGGTLTIDDSLANSGTIAASGGTVQALGSITGAGSATISNGGLLELGGTDAQTVTFNDAATLKLDNVTATSFTGQIDGLTIGDIIELSNISVTSAVINGSTLLVTESNGSKLSYSIAAAGGSFASDYFHIESDNAGGTDLVLSVNTTTVAEAVPSGLNGQENVAIAFTGDNAITISDSPNTGDLLTTTLTVSHGTLSIGSADGTTVTYGNNDASVQLVGTAAQITAALATASYTGASNYYGADSLVVATSDAASGSSQSKTVGITLTDTTTVAEAVPSGLNGQENVAIAFTGDNAITISDSPNTGDLLTTTLTVSHGTLSIGSADGTTVTYGNNDASVQLVGTAAQITAALATASYTGASNYYGADSLVVATSDAASGSSQSKTVGITLTDTTTVAEAVPSGLNGQENVAIAFTGDNAITISDSPNTGDLLTTTLTVSHGTLSIGSADGTTVTYGNNDGSVQLVGTAAQITAALATASYTGASNYYGADSLVVATSDAASGSSQSKTVGITLTDTTTVAEAVPSGLNGQENVAIAFTGDNAITISDSPNTGDLLTTTLTVSHGTLSIGSADGTTVTYGNNDGSVQLVGTAAQITAALATASYTGASNYYGADSLVVATSDAASGSSQSKTVGITLTDTTTVAETVPSGLNGQENVAIAFTGDNAITISDSPNTGDLLTTTLTVSHGTLSIGSADGTTVTYGNNDGSVQLVGTAAQITAALATASYTGASNYYGADSLVVATSDAASGSSQSKTVGITLTDTTTVAEAVPSGLNGQENVAIAFTGDNAITISDSPNTGDLLTTTLTVSHGTLSIGSADGTTVTYGNNDASVQLVGTAAQITAALATASYTGASNYYGADSLVVATSDAASGSSQSKTVGITLTDTTTVAETVPSGLNGQENVAIAFTGDNAITISDSPNTGDLLTTTLTVSHGTLSIGSADGTTVTYGNNDGSVQLVGTAAQITAALATASYTGRQQLLWRRQPGGGDQRRGERQLAEQDGWHHAD